MKLKDQLMLISLADNKKTIVSCCITASNTLKDNKEETECLNITLYYVTNCNKFNISN